MAATGQVRPRGYTPNVPSGQGYQTPPAAGSDVFVFPDDQLRETAPCPSGTVKQSDGTCLQSGTVTSSAYGYRRP